MEPEKAARRRIDAALAESGWVVQDYVSMNLSTASVWGVTKLLPQSGRRQGR